jgi:hypothetical protein
MARATGDAVHGAERSREAERWMSRPQLPAAPTDGMAILSLSVAMASEDDGTGRGGGGKP